MAQVTLSDVARVAGVSLATASRVLNGSSRVPGKVISQRVAAAARKLGYVPNASAQALARSSSGLLGVVIQDLEDPYFSTIAAGFQEAAGAEGRLVLLAHTSRDADLTIAALRGLNAQRVDGVLMVGSLNLSAEQRAVFGEQLTDVVHRGGRVVSVGQGYGVGRTIYPDDRNGGLVIGRAMVAAGYRRFAILESTSQAPSAAERTAGFVEAVKAAGFGIDHRVPGAMTTAGGRDAAALLVRRIQQSPDDEPVCFFAMTDAVGLPVMGRAVHAGIAVPERLGIVGFDGVAAGRDVYPALSTYDLPLHAMGRHAFALVSSPEDAELPRGWVAGEGTITVPGTLRLAGSTMH